MHPTDCDRPLEQTEFPLAKFDETNIIQGMYLGQDAKVTEIDATIFEITKVNFAAAGAVVLFGKSNLISDLGGETSWYMLAGLIVIISVAASVMVTFFHKYQSVQAHKAKILLKAIVRRRPLSWIEIKYCAENIPEKSRAANSLNPKEFFLYGYILTYINMLPAGLAIVAILFHVIY